MELSHDTHQAFIDLQGRKRERERDRLRQSSQAILGIVIERRLGSAKLDNKREMRCKKQAFKAKEQTPN